MGEGFEGSSASHECLKQNGFGQQKLIGLASALLSLSLFVKSFLGPEAFFMALFYLHSLTHYRIISYFLLISF